MQLLVLVLTVLVAVVGTILVLCSSGVSAGGKGSGQCRRPYDPCVNITESKSRKACYGNRLLALAERGNLCRVEELLNQHLQEAAFYVDFSEHSPGKKKGYTALLWAAEKNDTDLVYKLVEEYDSNVNHKSWSGWSALLLCVVNGNVECTELLLNNSADPDIMTKGGYTSIILAAWNRFSRIVKTLLEHKADVDAVTPKTNYSALYLAARNGDLQIVNHLVNSGCNINIQTSWGVTPLLVATYWGHIEVVKYLLSNGGDPNIQQIEGYTVLHKAVYYNHPTIVDALIKRGDFDINIKSNNSYTALMLAVRNGDVKMVTKLIDNGAKVNPQDEKGYTALMLAVRNGQVSMVTKLLNAGADVNLQDETGRTAVHWAAGSRDVEVMKELLAKCPDLTIHDDTKKTAVDIAKMEIISIIEGHNTGSCR
ncbi:hypothetical protein Pmani_014558 [Petrolisthes manimaculis]|uniref:Uncharacterized protein n=1 Tax=Petrolisthes manimaculis TaxID=1843537 RepID=A0AAE1PTS7_9EUCA|nr:hypothetical protein Pmani_014558 [Petrolisthes manimaculis]